MTGNFEISLVLATYGRTDDIGRLVDSLIAQTDLRFELIFVDQNLDERVAPYVQKARSAGIETVHLRMNQPNLSKARNLGLTVARGTWVAFPDDDCWYERETLSAVLSAPGAGVDAWVMSWVEHDEAIGIAAQHTRFELKAWKKFRGGDASSITLVFRRKLTQQLGGFDEKLGVGQWFGAGEETDFVIRALAFGARIQRLDSARVHHRFSAPSNANAGAFSWRATQARARGTGALYAKHCVPVAVVVRGFLAPVLKAVFRARSLWELRKALAIVTGRMQGWWTWQR